MAATRLVLGVPLMLGLLAAASAAGAQTSGGVKRVGVIHLSGEHHAVVDGLREGLRELGLEEGRHLVLGIRATKYDVEAIEAAARDLERGRVDLLYTVTTPVTSAAKRATTQTPIVFYGGADPVTAGFVQSLARPGGRLTGVHVRSSDLTPKRLEVLREILPRLGRVVTFYDPGQALSRENARLGREAARQLRVEFVERPVRSIEELRRGLEVLKPREADAYFHTPDALVTSQARLVIDAARAKRLPTMFHHESLVEQGALASYGASFREIGRMSAKYVQRVLAGTPPKDLPVENYDKIELALNLRTAREIGLTIPPAVRVRADKIIE